MGDRVGEEDFLKIARCCRLQEEEAEKIRSVIRRGRVEALAIRDVLSEEGRTSRRAFYLLDGEVAITVGLTNKERAVVKQVGKGQLLNLEVVLSNWVNQYSIIVSSSSLRFIAFSEPEILLLTARILPDLQEKAQLLEREVGRRNRKIREEERRRRMEENINRLILPALNPPPHRTSSLAYQRQAESLSSIPLFSKQLAARTPSLLQLRPPQSRYSEGAASHELQQFHANGKLVEKKLERLKSERSASLNEREEVDYSRNEKLFKEQLKGIVRRKLLFERKHFKIHANFKQAPSAETREGEVVRKYGDDNPIDNYFVL